MLELFEAIAQEIRAAGPRTVVLTDRSNLLDLRRLTTEREPAVSRRVRELWKSQGTLITTDVAEAAAKTAFFPQRTMDALAGLNAKFVTTATEPELVAIMGRSAEKVARRINAARKDFAFSMSAGVEAWVREHGAALVTRLDQALRKTLNAVLQRHVVQEALSPYELAKRLRAFIGLTDRQSRAVFNYYDTLLAEGASRAAVAANVEKYASFLHRYRAMTIARTELADGYNRGQFEALMQARCEGWLDGEVEKEWLTAADERICGDCEEMDGERVPIDQVFSCGVMTPTLHPDCRCGVGYEVVRR